MTVTDPVCGAPIDLAKVAAQEDHDGWAYFFCSTQCHHHFVASPGRYLARERMRPVSPPPRTERDDHGQG